MGSDAVPLPSIVSSPDTENNCTLVSTANSETPTTGEKNIRRKRRRLFHDEEPEILDVKNILIKNDLETRTSNGHKIISTAASRQPLNVTLRRKLVSTLCLALMNKTNSDRPSTDQREQLADCLVEQLFPYMSQADKQNLKLSYFTPSNTYKDANGKSVSKRPMGYIQSFFVNFWQSNKSTRPVETLEFQDYNIDVGTEEEIQHMQDWLKKNRGPPQKVFEKLNQTFHTRKTFIQKQSNLDFSAIILSWPRLFDVDGAIQNDFSLSFPLVADNFSHKWKDVSGKILKYGEIMRRSLVTVGISVSAVLNNPEIAALFMLAFLIRSRNKKISQLDSVKSFLNVVQTADVDNLLEEKSTDHPEVFLLGSKTDLSFNSSFVLFNGKVVKCASILEAVDLAYKSFYLFGIEFPSSCSGAWQFLDYAIFNMKVVVPVLSSVKELAAYCCSSN